MKKMLVASYVVLHTMIDKSGNSTIQYQVPGFTHEGWICNSGCDYVAIIPI